MELGAKATSGMKSDSSDAADSSLREGAYGVVSFSLELCFRVLYNTYIDINGPYPSLWALGLVRIQPRGPCSAHTVGRLLSDSGFGLNRGMGL